MPKNLVRKEFQYNGSWTAPAGVKRVRAILYRRNVGQVGTTNNAGLLIDPEGNLYGWGPNGSGTVGDNTTTNRSSPVLVAGGRRWLAVGGGKGGSAFGKGLVLNADGTVSMYAWGDNADGRIGDNTTTTRSSPSLVSGTMDVRMTGDGGSGGAFIVTNGDMYAWGLNNAFPGYVGDNTITDRSSPVLVVGSRKWKYVSMGNTHSTGIDSNDDAFGWGVNTNGMVGDNSTSNRSSPVAVVGGLKFAQISAGSGSTFAITAAGDMYSWGLNSSGQLGHNTVTNRSSPVLVVGGRKWASVSAGADYVLAVDTDGNGYAWGGNSTGQLGDTSTTSRSSPVAIAGGFKFAQLAAGGSFSHGLGISGSVYGWGDNSSAAVGDNSTTNRSSPVQVAGLKLANQARDVLIDDKLADVVPGTTYAVTLFAGNALLGTNIVAGANLGLTKIVLEYYA